MKRTVRSRQGRIPVVHSGVIFDMDRIVHVVAEGHKAHYTEYNGVIHFWSPLKGRSDYFEPVGSPIEVHFFLYVKKHVFGQTKFAGYADWYKVVEFFTNPNPEEMEKARLMYSLHKTDGDDD